MGVDLFNSRLNDRSNEMFFEDLDILLQMEK